MISTSCWPQHQLPCNQRRTLQFRRILCTGHNLWQSKQICLAALQPSPEMASDKPIPEYLLPAAAKGLVFDADGTLLNSMHGHFAAWRHTCKHFGLKISATTLVELAGKPVDELLTIVSARNGVENIDREAFFKMKSQYYLDNAAEVAAIEDVAAIAHAGKARGLPMAVASGGTREHVVKGLTSTGLLDLFSAVVTAEDVEHGKPAPDVFLLAASKIGVQPEHCVGYEDAVLGMQAIKAAGFLAAIDVTLMPGYPHLKDEEAAMHELGGAGADVHAHAAAPVVATQAS